MLVRPTRRAPDAPPFPPPELPAAARHIQPMTLEAVVRQKLPAGGSRSTRQTITRTAERIHLRAEKAREWLFERNPLDPKRVSAWLVDHKSRVVVVYEESELRNTMGINGWADVLTLGVDASRFAELTLTSERRTRGGIRFSRYVSKTGHSQPSEIWWNAEQALPQAIVSNGKGGASLVVDKISSVVDTTVLRSPAVRFPSYVVIDLADWLERH